MAKSSGSVDVKCTRTPVSGSSKASSAACRRSGKCHRDRRGCVVDFRALRHRFISNLVNGGVPPVARS